MLFALTATYSPETIRAMIQNPVDRSQAARKAIEAIGGKLLSFHGTLGGDQQGILAIYDLPDGTSQAALCNTVWATGALTSLSTYRLLSSEEMVQALHKAREVQAAYDPPGTQRQ